ncbi:MAG: serine hydrolase domain-containing protein [Opitutaceae bacterium]|jgi:D-alanyl-D-alanine carboxypeptidase
MTRPVKNKYTSFALSLLVIVGFSASAAKSVAVEPSQIVNLSARAQVGPGSDALVGGFVISGNVPKRLMIRAAGPALGAFGLTSSLTTTKITLYSGSKEIAASQGPSSASNAEDIPKAISQVGAFPYTGGGQDSTLIVTLDPGAYTAMVSSPDGNKGVALLEVFELPATGGSILTPEKQAKIQQLVDAAISKYEIPGIMYAIKFRGEEPWAKARGVRDTVTKDPLQPNDYFRIGSNSKTFIGNYILKLVQDNRLKLDMPISKLLPADVLSKYPRDTITVRMLLNHTSGIRSYTDLTDDWFIPYIYDRKKVWTDLQLVALVNGKFSDPEEGQVEQPGVAWHYSNTNTVLLGLIIERIEGKAIGKIMQQNVFTPLGLKNTFYPASGDSSMPTPYAHGYMNWANYVGVSFLPNTDQDVSVYEASGVGPAGSIISTTSDLTRWIEAVACYNTGNSDFRRGHIDWKYFTDFGVAAYTPGLAASSYGLHMAHETDSTNQANYWIVGHRGQIAGYDCAMEYLPQYEVALVVTCNRSLKNAPGFPTNALSVALNDIIKVLLPQIITDNPAKLTTAEASTLGYNPDQFQSLQADTDNSSNPKSAMRGRILSEYK